MKVTFPYMQVHPLSASVCRGGLCSLSKADHIPTCTVNDRLTASNKLYAFHNFFFFLQIFIDFRKKPYEQPYGQYREAGGKAICITITDISIPEALPEPAAIKESHQGVPRSMLLPPRSQFSIQRGTSPHMLQSNRRIQVGNS